MKFTIEEYAAMIEGSQYRKKAESAMRTFFGETDLHKVNRPNLKLFLQDVLPRLIPDTLGGEADDK